MGIKHLTIQKIYDTARERSHNLVNGKILEIEGDDYKLSSDFRDEENCKGY